MRKKILTWSMFLLGLILSTICAFAYDIETELTEGETKTITVNNLDYDIYLPVVSENGLAKFIVNGETTDSLSEGESYTVADGSVITVIGVNVTINESDMVKFGFTTKKESNCKDSDGGIDYYERGYITEYDNIEVPDFCIDSNRLKELYCSRGSSAELTYTCPNGCRDGACIEGSSRVLPPFIMAIYDKAPASDVILTAGVGSDLQEKGYKNIPVATSKLFSEVNGLQLDNMVTLVVYQGEAIIIVGEHSPSSHVIFAVDLAEILSGKGINTKSILSSEVPSADLIDLFAVDDTIVIIKEKIECVFENTNSIQECHSPESEVSCEGVGRCTVEVYGEKGKRLTWKSSCGGYKYTTMNGKDEVVKFSCGTSSCKDSDNGVDYYVRGHTKADYGSQLNAWDICGPNNVLTEFYCKNNAIHHVTYRCPNECQIGACIKPSQGKPDLVIQNLRYKKQSSDLATIEFDIVNIGKGNTKEWFAIAVYIDGDIHTHTLYNEQRHGTRYGYDEDAVIQIKPGERRHKSLSNYYWLANGKHTITVVVDRFDEGDITENPLYENIRANMIDESNEYNNKASITIGSCEEVCKYAGTRSEGWYDSCTGDLIKYDNCGTSGKYVYLNEKFEINEGDSAKVVDYNYMKVTLNSIIEKCVVHTTASTQSRSSGGSGGGGGGCVLIGTKVQVEMDQDCETSANGEACDSTGTEFILKKGESRVVFGAVVSLVTLKGNRAVFLVREQSQEDYVDAYIEPKEQTIKYGDYRGYEVTIVDKHPIPVCIPEETCTRPTYSYQIVVRNLPFLKEYPEKIILNAGEEKSFTLTVRPYQTIIGEKSHYEKEYKFNVRAKLLGDPKVEDSVHAVLKIRPKEPIEPPLTPPAFPGEEVGIKMYKGWNLVSLPGKLMKFEANGRLTRKLLGFVYLKDEQRYVTMKEAQRILGEDFQEYLAKNAFWVYSYTDYTLKSRIDREISFDQIMLNPKWNLIPVTDDMVGGYLSDLKGYCEFEKIYKWDAQTQSWGSITEDYVFEGDEVHKGILVKANDYCAMGGATITALTPPTMPE